MADWQPLLEEAIAEQARAAIRAIGDDLTTRKPPPELAGPVALFWAYAAGIWDDATTNERYEAAIDALLARISEGEYSSHDLTCGIAGDGWVVSHIASDGAEAILSEIDRVLVEVLSTEQRWTDDYDLISGLVGYGVYFLERLAGDPSAQGARAGLASVVRHLEMSSIEDDSGVRWWTPPEHILEGDRKRYPHGYANCGLAHGVAGAIALLARIGELNDSELAARAATLARKSARWLWARQLPPNPVNRFPAFVGRGLVPSPTRTGWCYGDLGVAIALWRDDPVAAHALGLEVTRRSHADTGVVDACLCHGAAGNAHLFARMFHASGDSTFRDAACEWWSRGLAMRRADAGGAGFVNLEHGEWVASPSLLTGGIGIGLSFMAAVHGADPGWDRLLLCDLPERT